MKVGDTVRHIVIRSGQLIHETQITGETKTQWITTGNVRWAKSTRAKIPQYKPEPRAIAPCPPTTTRR